MLGSIIVTRRVIEVTDEDEKTYINVKGQKCHTLFCECSGCTPKLKYYARAFKDIRKEL